MHSEFAAHSGSLQELGVTVALEKCEGPSVCIVFLGIEIDYVSMEMRLPRDKLERLKETIKNWRGSKSCTKRELLSAIIAISYSPTNGMYLLLGLCG